MPHKNIRHSEKRLAATEAEAARHRLVSSCMYGDEFPLFQFEMRSKMRPSTKPPRPAPAGNFAGCMRVGAPYSVVIFPRIS